MQGRDCFKRLFFVVKFIVDKKDIGMQVFFQRYTDDHYTWQSARCRNKPYLIDTSGGIDCNQVKLISDIINGETVKLTKEHRPNYNRSFINKKVMIYDKKKIDAVRKIEKQWEKSRWDPAHKLCRTIQIREIKQLIPDIK